MARYVETVSNQYGDIIPGATVEVYKNPITLLFRTLVTDEEGMFYLDAPAGIYDFVISSPLIETKIITGIELVEVVTQFKDLEDTPKTLKGYGISDAFTKDETNAEFATKAELAAVELLPGPQGPTGAQGEVGPQGPQGDGLRITGSVTDPSLLPTEGNTEGDCFLVNGNIWAWHNGAWVDAGPIQGPAGETGPVGPQGPQGPAGLDSTVQGPQGPVGPPGEAGPVGADSTVPGPAGAPGEIGPAGPAGADGAPGPTGLDSTVPGPAGPQGEVGPAGPAGPQGEVGPQGPQGADSTVPGPAGPAGTGGTPLGTIAIWSGTIESVPAGWLPCDGLEGRPDLRNRFIIGASDVYPVGTAGGTADAVVVAHNHALTDPGHAHLTYGSNGGGGNGGGDLNSSTGLVFPTSAAATGITIDSAGVDGINANLPPYYSLLYIIKVTGDISDGLQGPAGPAGPQGEAGPAGPAGLDSQVPGPQGPQGEVGPQGPAGLDSQVPGPQGPAGAAGAVTWNGVGQVVNCSMVVGPGSGAVTRGTIYALGVGSYQINIESTEAVDGGGTYAGGYINATPAENLSGQWAWYSRGWSIAATGGASGALTTMSINGQAIKVAD